MFAMLLGAKIFVSFNHCQEIQIQHSFLICGRSNYGSSFGLLFFASWPFGDFHLLDRVSLGKFMPDSNAMRPTRSLKMRRIFAGARMRAIRKGSQGSTPAGALPIGPQPHQRTLRGGVHFLGLPLMHVGRYPANVSQP